MEGGRIRLEGSSDALRADEAVRDSYLASPPARSIPSGAGPPGG
jgi:hypothetical protein